jgi:hypothetical protein
MKTYIKKMICNFQIIKLYIKIYVSDMMIITLLTLFYFKYIQHKVTNTTL